MKLNLGGGRKRKPGYKNVDLYVVEEGDFKWDLKFGLPDEIKDNSVDAINAEHIFEHIPSLYKNDDGKEFQPRKKLLNDCWRVLKPGAQIEIYVPHRLDNCAYTDDTHEWFMDESSLDPFCVDDNGSLMGEYNREYGFNGAFKKVLAEGIKFTKHDYYLIQTPTQIHFILEAIKE